MNLMKKYRMPSRFQNKPGASVYYFILSCKLPPLFSIIILAIYDRYTLIP